MLNPLTLRRWSPFAAGALLGVLSWATFYFMDKPLGVSTSVCHAAATVIGAVDQQAVHDNPYFAKLLTTKDGWKPVFDWQFALVSMMAVGAFFSARLGRGFDPTRGMPTTWSARFGPSRPLRWAGAFIGGFILIFGARLADGCTSGHAISGGLQLALSSWVFMIAMFATGTATGLLLYGRKGA